MRAIVVGGSIAGLLAARALSDFVESVSIVDRDVPPDTAVPRQGVPQGRHVHGVLAGGLDALRFFFPTIQEDLTAEGSCLADVAENVLWFNHGAWRLRCKCGITGSIQTRPLLELIIRRRIAQLPNVSQLCGVAVTGLQMDATKSRVTGVRVDGAGGDEEILRADLVVDCSGRGSKTPAWLEASGLGKPPATTVVVNVGYSTRYFRVPEKCRPDWHALLILGTPPKGTRLGACFCVESGELQVTLGGQFRDYPPDDEAGFLKFAESLENPELFRTIQHAIPASPIATYRFPAHLWNHYERLKDLPSNLLVLGDALSSFNPIYGQGMTVAAQEAQVLHGCLVGRKLRMDGVAGLRRQYFRGVSSIVKAAWAMATGADLAYPQAEGQRPYGQAILLRYLGHVIALGCYDKRVLTTWNQVTNMQRPLSALFAPSIVARVMSRALMGDPPLNASRAGQKLP
jgi:2-polyprenyl-6-methoxyphenol hydroxylase-like FAD-dependent oxidoreductase